MKNYESNIRNVLSEIQKKKETALEAVGVLVEGEAIVRTPVDTGNLKNSITHKVDGNMVIIGTNVEYAVKCMPPYIVMCR